MATDSIGLYVHTPFCVSKCKYCDFASFSAISCSDREKYVDKLVSEIESYDGEKREVNSIFFGGGTPSLLTVHQMGKIVDAIKNTFLIADDCEFTVEVNPKTVDKEKLDFYRRTGVNRISIGMQSIHENELKYLGRIHTFDEFLECYNAVLDSGISNVSVDLMYGIPQQTVDSFIATVKKVIELGPAHISVYGLIIEPGTPFYSSRDSLPIPDEDDEVSMYYSACDLLGKAGYLHYEISNYSKPQRECRHNLKYWQNEEFIGFGLSAYSYVGNKRYGNTRNFNEYLLDDYVKYRTVDEIGLDEERFEYIMMHLRTSYGVSRAEYFDRFGVDFAEEVNEKLRKYVDLGYVECLHDRVRLTEKGFYLSNTIISEIV